VPRFRIHLINSEFESFDESDYPSLDAARQMAIKTATRIAADTIVEGITTTAVAVEIHEGEEMLTRQVVTISVSDLGGVEATAD